MAKDRLIIANCVINAVLSCTTIMLNIGTILALRKTSLALSKNFKTVLLSLSVADLGVGLLVQPLNITIYVMQLEQNDKHNLDLLESYVITTNLLGLASFLNLTVLSADRFLAIDLHLRYQELVTHRRVVAVVISIWVFVAFISLFGLWRPAKATLSYIIVIILIVCLIFTALISCKIFLVVRRHVNNIQEMQGQQGAQNGAVMENDARQKKSAAVVFYLYLVLLVCYLPTICINVANIILGPGHVPMIVGICFDILLFLNSSLNPLIYCWKIKHIRHAIKDVLRNIFPTHD